MTSPIAYERAEFVTAIDHVEPRVYASLRDLFEKRAAAGEKASRADVDAWATEWNLNAQGLEWHIEDVYRDARSGILLGRPMPWDFDPPTHQIPLVLMPWQPAETGESRKVFHERALKVLAEYEKCVQSWAREKGIARVFERERDTGMGVARWELLARRLVLGAPGGTDGVRKQISNLARKLGIVLPGLPSPVRRQRKRKRI